MRIIKLQIDLADARVRLEKTREALNVFKAELDKIDSGIDDVSEAIAGLEKDITTVKGN